MKPCIATFIQILLYEDVDQSAVLRAASTIGCEVIFDDDPDGQRILVACPDVSFFIGWGQYQSDTTRWNTISLGTMEALEEFILGQDLSTPELALREGLGESWLSALRGAVTRAMSTTIMEPGHA